MKLLKCDRLERDDCKTDEEIYEHFGDQLLLLMKNEIRFDSDEYKANSIIQEATIEVINLGYWQEMHHAKVKIN